MTVGMRHILGCRGGINVGMCQLFRLRFFYGFNHILYFLIFLLDLSLPYFSLIGFDIKLR
ncbi:hypothetical protein DSUL_40072 [Desulfovibrionales bacterium]